MATSLSILRLRKAPSRRDRRWCSTTANGSWAAAGSSRSLTRQHAPMARRSFPDPFSARSAPRALNGSLPMRIFIYELISAGGLGDDMPTSLRSEGATMLRAVVADFERILGVKALTLLANDFPESIGRNCHRVAAVDEPRAFRDIAVQADTALIIAPEFDN